MNEVTRQVLGIVGLSYKGDYSSSTTYNRGNVVVYDGSSYVAKTTTKGNLPTNTTYFQLIARKPIKGVDYFTEEDIQAIVDEITLDAESEFNQNVEEKTAQFNQNATDKTDTFNSNATSKTGTFNDNATSKTTAYNNNASDKTDAYNLNASNKTTAFDGNASDKTTAFNNNATSKTGDFDSNASSKTTAYNENHTTKLGEYNQNASDKLTAYNNNHTAKLSAYNENAEEKVEEFDEHVDELEERVEVLETVVDGLPHVTEEGTDIQLQNTIEGPLKSKLSPSELEQNTYNGNQLVNFNNLGPVGEGTTVTFNNNILTVSGSSSYSSGSIIITDLYKNNGGKTLKFNYKNIDISNQLGIIVALIIVYKDSSSPTYPSLLNHDLNTPSIVIPQDVSNIDAVRFRVFSNNTSAVQNSSVTIEEPMLYFDDNDTYEPYVGRTASPSPDYPQEVKRIWGDNSLKIINGNWFNFKATPTVNNSVGQITILDNGVRLGNSTTQYRYVIYVIKGLKGLSNKIIRLKGNVNVSGTTRTCNYSLGICDENGDNRTQKVSGNNEEINFTVSTEEANSGKYFYVGLYLTTNVSIVSTDYTDFTNMMLTIDNENIEYVPYEEKILPLNLGVVNLFNDEMELGGIQNGENLNSTATYRTKGYTEILPSKNYAFGVNGLSNKVVISFYDENKQWINQGNSLGYESQDGLFTTPSNAKYLRFRCYASDKDLFETGRMQLEEGSKAHSYSEYGVEPIEYCKIGDYKDEFKISDGSQLFDKDNVNIVDNAFINVSGYDFIYYVDSTKDIYRTFTIEINPSTTYTISKIVTSRFAVATSPNAPTDGTIFTNGNQQNSSNSITITSGPSDNYLTVWFMRTDLDTTITEQEVINSIMICKGSKQIEWQPYGKDKWYLKKNTTRINIKDLVFVSFSTTYNRITTKILGTCGEEQNIQGLCNVATFKTNTSVNLSYTNTIVLREATTQRNAYLWLDGITTEEQAISYLSSNNDYIICQKTIPSYIKITGVYDTLNTQLDKLYKVMSKKGQTNISQENEELPFQISASALRDINSMFESLETRIAELETE